MPNPSLADEHHARLDPAAAARELADLQRLTADPLRALGSGIPTPHVARARQAAVGSRRVEL